MLMKNLRGRIAYIFWLHLRMSEAVWRDRYADDFHRYGRLVSGSLLCFNRGIQWCGCMNFGGYVGK
eukprot:591289-Amorphochlora_amoeboformis.AAC.1